MANYEQAGPALPAEVWSHRSDLFVIGITGNIAVGKSTVDGMIQARGAQVVDADRLVRELQRKGQPVWKAIVAHFGHGILTADEELDRARLGDLVFANPRALRDLELIVHPAVRGEIRRRLKEAEPGSVLALDAIKLFESGMAGACDTVWAVLAPSQVQLERLRSERGLSLEAARSRIEAQPPQEEKARRATLTIDNGGSLDETQRQVDEAWDQTAGAWLRTRLSGPR